MIRAFLLLVLAVMAGSAQAQNCPAFFRFVDFGLQDSSGTLYRGGTIFRAESLSGRPLLYMDQTECLDVAQIASDGHGNPIPVVSAISYDPARLELDVAELRVRVSEDIEKEAMHSARAHQAALGGSVAKLIRGEAFLCASLVSPARLSCQVASPVGGNLPLVVYCDGSQCRMPVLALNRQLVVAAAWEVGGALPHDETARAISARIRQIHDFLMPLSSGV